MIYSRSRDNLSFYDRIIPSMIEIGLAALAAIVLILEPWGWSVAATYRITALERSKSCGLRRDLSKGGGIVASHEEAGFQTRLLRGGLHFGLYPFQFAVHKQPLITVAEGKIAYLYARDGANRPSLPTQTLGKVTKCNGFQDAAAFIENGGQRGCQRATLREGVYAINTALFVVITEDVVLEAEPGERQRNLQRLAGRAKVLPTGFSRSYRLWQGEPE